MRWLVVLAACVSLSLSGCDLNPQPEVPSDTEDPGTDGAVSGTGVGELPGPSGAASPGSGKTADRNGSRDRRGGEFASNDTAETPPVPPADDAGGAPPAPVPEEDAGPTREVPDGSPGVLN